MQTAWRFHLLGWHYTSWRLWLPCKKKIKPTSIKMKDNYCLCQPPPVSAAFLNSKGQAETLLWSSCLTLAPGISFIPIVQLPVHASVLQASYGERTRYLLTHIPHGNTIRCHAISETSLGQVYVCQLKSNFSFKIPSDIQTCIMWTRQVTFVSTQHWNLDNNNGRCKILM